MKISDVYPGKYMKADDIPPTGRTGTVARCVLEEIGPERDRKPVLYFREDPKGLVLNKTNFQLAADLLGNDSDEWDGGRLEIYPARVEFQGRTTMGIRIRAARQPKMNPATSRTAPPSHGKELLNKEDLETDAEPETEVAVADYDDDEPLALTKSASGGRQRG